MCKCNYECGFCFHTAKTSHILPLEDSFRGLKLLNDAGMRKINFAGGEPFLYPKYLASLIIFCKEELQLESVSIITNGSLVTERFLRDYGKHIDTLGVSCDSFIEATNIKIGRPQGGHIDKFQNVSRLCREFGIKFKLNRVVNRYNINEDMNEHIEAIAPFQWKCFQVLVVDGENNSQSTLRDATRFVVTDEEFTQFCNRHRHHKSFIPEPNDVMMSSYLLLDEYMRFLDKNVNLQSDSILDVGEAEALSTIRWDEENFSKRGGIYDWSKEKDAVTGGYSTRNEKLEW
jgi:radical S-adenosyl methionine domain-containing protein 2